jgi:hypothetical protein
MQEWEKIKGFENYSVSNDGEVRNDRTGRILKPHLSTSGYYQVMMGRKTVPQYVHRLVAIAFISNPDNKKQVDHIDGNKRNNCINNLRWVTASENCLGYGLAERNKHRQKHIIAKHRDGRVLEFNSRTETAEYFKCDKSQISYEKEYKKGNKKGWIFEIVI